VALLGPPRIEDAGLPVELATRKATALLAYLAVTGERHNRDALAALLWPEADQAHARNTLRYTLSVLKQALGGAWLDVGRESVGLRQGEEAWLDVDHFHRQLATCRMHGHRETDVCPACLPALTEAVALYRGDFLVGFTLRDSPAFDEWQFLTGERLRGELASALARLVRYHSTQAAWEPAIDYARRWVALDPLHEPAQRQLMQVYAWAGRRAAALRQYHACARLVEQELGAPPSEETTQLFMAIKERRLAQLEVGLAASPTPPADSVEQASRDEYLIEPAEESFEREPGAFVARERELVRLRACLDRALACRGQVVFVIGEAGSGKTALLQEFARRAIDTSTELIVAGANCNAHTGIGDPYLPFREILGLLTGDVEARSGAGMISLAHIRRLRALIPVAVPALVDGGADLIGTFVPGAPLAERAAASTPHQAELLARLERIVERKAAESGAPSPDQQRMFEQYTNVLTALAAQRPLLLVLDDLQWADAASINLLFHLGRRIERSRILIVGAYRPDDVAIGRAGERHLLEPVVNELTRYFGDVRVDLDRANDEEGRRFVDALLDSEPNRLGPDFRAALYHQTEGQPLFTVELLRGLQERGDLVQDEDGRWVAGPALGWETLPARIEGAIAERIGRLPEELMEALAVASVEGEVFTAEVIARVQAADAQAMVRRLSGALERRQRLVRSEGSQTLGEQRVSRFRFRHFLFQKYLYNHLDAAERAYLHEDVGDALEALYGERAEAIAVQLARHFAEAGRAAKAVGYLLDAGKQGLRLSAHQEAIAHVTRGLALLATLPKMPERARQELMLHTSLGSALVATKGYAAAEVAQAFSRAHELCRQVGETPQLGPVLRSLASYYHVRAEFQVAQPLNKQLLALALRMEDPALLVPAHQSLGAGMLFVGEYAPARAHLEQGIACYDLRQHRALAFVHGHDPGVSCLSHLAIALWGLGYPDQALARSREGLALAEELAYPFSLGHILHFTTVLHCCRREAQAAQERAEANIALATEHGFPLWLTNATSLRGWAMVLQGGREEWIAQIRQGLADYLATGGKLARPVLLCHLADAYGRLGQHEAGLAVVDEALAAVNSTGERWWEAELYRLKGALLLKWDEDSSMKDEIGDACLPEACFQTAIEVARRQQSKSWELRATVSLSRLLQRQGRREEARQMLAEIYGFFTEGFDTPDLREAGALLEALS
jgi:DNA-binding SARP family transcriptional activator/predicted ATPase